MISRREYSKYVLVAIALMSACAVQKDEQAGLRDLVPTDLGNLSVMKPETLLAVPQQQQHITSLNYTTYVGFGGYEDGDAIAIDSSGNAYLAGETESFGGVDNIFVAKFSPSGSNLYFTLFPGVAGDPSQLIQIAVDSAGNAYVVAKTAAGDTITKINSTGTGIVYSAIVAWEGISAVAVDSGGNAYLAGRFNDDVAVGKVNSTGTAFAYAVTFGGSGFDGAKDIAIDVAGQAYVVGHTQSSNFPVVNPFQSTLRGSDDVFVTKLNATGTGIVFSTYLGGLNGENGNGIAVDSNNSSYVTGDALAGFPTTSGAVQPLNRGSSDAFVTKFSSGGSLQYSTFVGGSSGDGAQSIAVTPAGAAYIIGLTQSTNLATTPGAFQPLAPASVNAFVAQLNTSGNALSYLTYLGGSGIEIGWSIAVNSSGRAYVSGQTDSIDFPTTVFARGGGWDAFVTTFNGP